jgi:hypothetical protein
MLAAKYWIMQIQWGSEYQTRPVIGWSILAETGHWETGHLKSGQVKQNGSMRFDYQSKIGTAIVIPDR